MHAVLLLVGLMLFNIYSAQNTSSLPNLGDILDFFSGNRTSGLDALESPDLTKTFTTDQLIKIAGFKQQVHSVVTADGYILRLTRILSDKVNGPPVLAVHGLFGASDSWLQRGRDEDLVFILADHGYDVWLADLRGNVYSSKHKNLSVVDDAAKFYDFSFHEIGVYDLSAIISHILKHTTHTKIFYIGYSMGTTCFLTLMSTQPKFNQYIESAILLAPIAFGVKTMRSKILNELIKQSEGIHIFFKKSGIYNILPRDTSTSTLFSLACARSMSEGCLNIISDILGWDGTKYNRGNVAHFLRTTLSGASVKNLIHYAQMYKTGNFTQFDYGKVRNIQLYNDTVSPKYVLSHVTSPVLMIYGIEDHFIDAFSFERLFEELPKVIHTGAIPHYSHLDYLYADDAPKVLYDVILRLLKQNTTRFINFD